MDADSYAASFTMKRGTFADFIRALRMVAAAGGLPKGMQGLGLVMSDMSITRGAEERRSFLRRLKTDVRLLFELYFGDEILSYIYPPLESMRIVTDIFAFCKNRVPRWNTISISGYHMREAGCTAVQEVAFTLADGIAYVEAAIRAGLDVDSFASRLAFFFCCHNTFIEEVAKFRAARQPGRMGADGPILVIRRCPPIHPARTSAAHFGSL